MVTTLEAAELSRHVYDVREAQLPDGFIFERAYTPADFGERGAVYNNFMCAAVYKRGDETVVAFRGSDNSANWFNHNLSFLAGRMSDRYQTFANQVAGAVGHNTTFVGHSAGAPMAIYASFRNQSHAIGFDSPDASNLGGDAAAWRRVTLVQANSVVSGHRFPEGARIFNVSNDGNPIAAHSMVHILRKLGDNPVEGNVFNSRSFFAGFGMDVDQVSPEVRNAVDAPFENISRLLKGDFQNQHLPEIINMASDMYRQLGVVGAHDRHIVKISQIGGDLINLGTNLGALDLGVPGLGAFAGISAVLNPFVGIAGAGLSLLSSFGFRRRRNRGGQDLLAPVVNRLQQLQVSFAEHFNQIARNQALLQAQIRHGFNQIINNQQILLQEMQHHFNLLFEAVNQNTYLMSASFHHLENRISRNRQIEQAEHRAGFLMPLMELLNTADDLLRDQDNFLRGDPLQIRFCETARGLFHWARDQSHQVVFNGAHYLTHQQERDDPVFVNEVLDGDPTHHNLLGYLAAQAQVIARQPFDGMDVTRLPNINIWMEALDMYLALLPRITADYPKLEELTRIREQSNDLIHFIRQVGNHVTLFENLFNEYRETRTSIINLAVRGVGAANQHRFEVNNIHHLFALGSPEALERERLLTRLQSIKKLIAAYSQLGGVELSHNMVSGSVLGELHRGFARQGAQNAPQWSDGQGFSQPQYYETIRTVVMEINNQDHVMALVRNMSGIVLYQYNPATNTWAQRHNGPSWGDLPPAGFNFPQYYKTLRAVVMSVNNHDQLFVIIRAARGFILHRYDPQTNEWSAAVSEGPRWSNEAGFADPQYYETFNANVVSINNHPQLIVTIRHPLGLLSIQSYDPVPNTWTVLPQGPALSNAAGFDQPMYYKTIRTNNIRVNGQEHLFLSLRNQDGVCGYLYNPRARTWGQAIRGSVWTDAESVEPETFQSAVVNIDGHDHWVVMIRQRDQLLTQIYNFQTQVWFELAPFLVWENDVREGVHEKIKASVITMNGGQKLVIALNTTQGLVMALYNHDARSWSALGHDIIGDISWTQDSIYKTMHLQSVAVNNQSQCRLFVRTAAGFESHVYRVEPNLREDLSNCAIVEREPALSTIALMAGGVLAQIDELALSLRPTPAPGVTGLFCQAGERVMGVFGLRSSRP